MRALPAAAWIALAMCVVALSSLLVQMSIRYAQRQQLIDHPGQRRSHKVATPRGGGIGIVVAALAGLSVLAMLDGDAGPTATSMALIGSIVVVACVGWIDDHQGLGVGLRLFAHGLAAILLGLPALGLLFPGAADNPAMPLIAIVWLMGGVAIVGSINLHNFMDGIDGLLTMQALFVFCVLAWVCLKGGRVGEAQVIGLFAAATLGFLPFNFPRARVFLGDVGSGALGLMIAVAVCWQMAAVPDALLTGFIASSAFLVDSTMTLSSRVISGRRWYSAHREHLYQWLVRVGFSHARVVGIYMGWNLAVALPAILWSLPDAPATGASALSSTQSSVAMVAVMALAVVFWIAGKRYCLRAIRRGSRTA